MHTSNPSKLRRLFTWSINFAVTGISSMCLANTGISSLQDSLPKSCYIAGNFQQHKQLADIPQALKSNGEFIFACDQGLIWHTREPHRETLIYRRDGKHQLILPDTEAERLTGRVHRELGKILNNLIGADIDYLNQHFDDTVTENHHALIPKNKRLRKFINSIGISPASGGTHISIIQQEQETTDITISQTQAFDSISADNCASLFTHQPEACALLFQ